MDQLIRHLGLCFMEGKRLDHFVVAKQRDQIVERLVALASVGETDTGPNCGDPI
ncbi:MAG: hypothetical protein ACM4D3_15035 [Candidatus Sericytochromatia bacterium]